MKQISHFLRIKSKILTPSDGWTNKFVQGPNLWVKDCIAKPGLDKRPIHNDGQRIAGLSPLIECNSTSTCVICNTIFQSHRPNMGGASNYVRFCDSLTIFQATFINPILELGDQHYFLLILGTVNIWVLTQILLNKVNHFK